MNCSNPPCNRGIGLVAYRRGWFRKWRYCSKHCRDAFVADAPQLQQKLSVTIHFDRLFLQPIATAEASGHPCKRALSAT